MKIIKNLLQQVAINKNHLLQFKTQPHNSVALAHIGPKAGAGHSVCLEKLLHKYIQIIIKVMLLYLWVF